MDHVRFFEKLPEQYVSIGIVIGLLLGFTSARYMYNNHQAVVPMCEADVAPMCYAPI